LCTKFNNINHGCDNLHGSRLCLSTKPPEPILAAPYHPGKTRVPKESVPAAPTEKQTTRNANVINVMIRPNLLGCYFSAKFSYILQNGWVHLME